MKDKRDWRVVTEIVPRVGWQVQVTCEGFPQGCWGYFSSEGEARRFGWFRMRGLRRLVPPGTENPRPGSSAAEQEPAGQNPIDHHTTSAEVVYIIEEAADARP